MSNLELDLDKSALIELKSLLHQYRAEIIKDLKLEESISCPECIIGNSDNFCYNYDCKCNHNECDMTNHSYQKLNESDDDYDTEEYCDDTCKLSCKYLPSIEGDKEVVAMILKEAMSINNRIFNKYNKLLNPNDKYFKKPYKLTVSCYYTN